MFFIEMLDGRVLAYIPDVWNLPVNFMIIQENIMIRYTVYNAKGEVLLSTYDEDKAWNDINLEDGEFMEEQKFDLEDE